MSDTFQIQKNMVLAFGTPVVAYQWPDSESINEQLAELALRKEQIDVKVNRSNRGGWHSGMDLFDWKGQAIQTLKTMAQEIVSELTRAVVLTGVQPRKFNYRFSAWANINRRHSYNQIHNHPDSVWSGVYYVACGQMDNGWDENGKLELIDPRTSVNMIAIKDSLMDGRYLVDPIPGLMVVFPSWLKHQVHPYYGEGERISIAFNVMVEEE
jgi:uncharacterized protein (TIGR02466 family)